MPIHRNQLIQRLPPADRSRLLDQCVEVDLVIGQVVAEPGQRLRHVYFPLTSFISLIASGDGQTGVEVGMAGREGMLGADLVIGGRSSIFRGVVQGSGPAWRIGADAFRRLLDESEALQRILHRYLRMHTAQLATAVVCQRFHAIGPRLARWLLLTQDRADATRFEITHEFMAYMLGVRRAGVTVAAGQLQRDGLIDYRRGQCTVVDREGLEAAACSCYASDRNAYRHLLG